MITDTMGGEYLAERVLDLLEASDLLADTRPELADRIAFFAGELAGCSPGVVRLVTERALEAMREA